MIEAALGQTNASGPASAASVGRAGDAPLLLDLSKTDRKRKRSGYGGRSAWLVALSALAAAAVVGSIAYTAANRSPHPSTMKYAPQTLPLAVADAQVAAADANAAAAGAQSAAASAHRSVSRARASNKPPEREPGASGGER